MVFSIVMSVTGENLKDFVRELPDTEYKALNISTPKAVKDIIVAAKEFIGSERRGGISDNIKSKKRSRRQYMIYVSPIKPWPAYSPNSPNVSRKASKVYPMAQERGYRPHWVHTQMMPPEVRGKYEKEYGPRKIFARTFTPYMLPAYLKTHIKNQKALRSALTKELKKLKGRKKLKGGKIGAVGSLTGYYDPKVSGKGKVISI